VRTAKEIPWVDDMPSIPLAHGIPVVEFNPTMGVWFAAVVKTAKHGHDNGAFLFDGHPTGTDGARLRVDLSTDPGFAHAVRYLAAHADVAPDLVAMVLGIEETTDEARTTVARLSGASAS
jgi:hypothetical protein